MVDANGRPTGNDNGFRTDPGSNWTHRIFSCVSTVKASVKTVNLEVNGAASLSNLIIKKIEDKTYNDLEPLPIWAVEGSGREMWERSPFWGLVNNAKSGSPGLQTLQRQHLYLPAGASSTISNLFEPNDSVAALDAPFQTLMTIYGKMSLDSNVGSRRVIDVTGAVSWELYMKWTDLSSSADTAGKITDHIVR